MANNLALQKKEHVAGLIAIVSDVETFREFERGLTIQKIVDKAVPISVMQKEVGTRQVAQALDLQLTRLVANLNLKWNLNDNQIQQIVIDLLDKYPNESLEDFILVFKRARQGEFGDLFRLDSPVIFSWMETYLDEKYAVIENKLATEKDDYFKPVKHEPSSTEWLKKWKSEIESIEIKKVAPMTERDIAKEGRETPKKVAYPTSSAEEVIKHELHLQYIRENYDARTADKKPNWLPEKEWIDNHLESIS